MQFEIPNSHTFTFITLSIILQVQLSNLHLKYGRKENETASNNTEEHL